MWDCNFWTPFSESLSGGTAPSTTAARGALVEGHDHNGPSGPPKLAVWTDKKLTKNQQLVGRLAGRNLQWGLAPPWRLDSA